MRREVSFDSKRSNNTFGRRAEAVDSEVDPSSSLALDSLDDAKLHQEDRFKHYFIDDKYLLYKSRVCVLAIGDFHL